MVTHTSASDPVSDSKPCCPVVYESVVVDLAYDVDLFSRFFEPAYFNEKTNSLHFESFEMIQFVQVFDASGKMAYQLPVMSNKLRLSKSMFDQGDYRLAFQLEDAHDQLVTYVTIN